MHLEPFDTKKEVAEVAAKHTEDPIMILPRCRIYKSLLEFELSAHKDQYFLKGHR